MSWILVYIIIINANPVPTSLGEYTNMQACFQARDQKLVELEAYEEIPPVNTQLVCIRTDETHIN